MRRLPPTLVLGSALIAACDRSPFPVDTSAVDTSPVDTCPTAAARPPGGRVLLSNATERTLYGTHVNVNIGWSVDAWSDRLFVGGGADSGGGWAPPNLGTGEAYVTTVPTGPTDVNASPLLALRGDDAMSQLGFAGVFTLDGGSVFLGEHHNFTTPEVFGGKAMLYPIADSAGYWQPTAEIVADDEDVIFSAFGWDVAVADVTGTGSGDLIVAAPAAPPYGDVLVYPGTSTGHVSMHDWSARVQGTTWGTQGYRPVMDNLAVHGDLDADGIVDVVIGAPLRGRDGDQRYGAVSVMCSPLVGDLTDADACLTLNGVDEDEYVGTSVDYLGDVDCDGYDDLVVGAQWAQANGAGSGRVYVVSGARRGELSIADAAEAVFDGPSPYGDVGFEVAGRFDCDGDGVPDLAAGAPGDKRQPDQTGRVYVFRGPFAGQLDVADSLELVGAHPNDRAGNAITPLADQDGDGRDELVIGAPYDSEWADKGGKVYVVFGFWPE